MNYNRTGEERKLIQKKKRKNRLYRRVCLCGHSFYVHTLVWEAFNGPIPEGMVINHKDECPSNNCLDNLMLCTQRENLLWGSAQERRIASHTGKNKPKWVIQLNENNEILHFYRSVRRAEKETGSPHSSVWACCNGSQKVVCTPSGEKFIWKFAE